MKPVPVSKYDEKNEEKNKGGKKKRERVKIDFKLRKNKRRYRAKINEIEN